jgi:hypothetical protein
MAYSKAALESTCYEHIYWVSELLSMLGLSGREVKLSTRLFLSRGTE